MDGRGMLDAMIIMSENIMKFMSTIQNMIDHLSVDIKNKMKKKFATNKIMERY